MKYYLNKQAFCILLFTTVIPIFMQGCSLSMGKGELENVELLYGWHQTGTTSFRQYHHAVKMFLDVQ